MKMNRIAFLPAVLLLQSCMLAEQLPRQITLRVVDPSGNPVPGAFAAGYSSNKGGGGEGVTNDEGEITVTARRDFAFWVRSSKEGYYNTMGSIGWPPPDPMDIVLKRKINPVPMVVGRVPEQRMPENDVVAKYDLEVADWLPPHGKGKTADLYFRLKTHEFSAPDGNRKSWEWHVSGEMWVENPHDGFTTYSRIPADSSEVKSELASPQEAPAKGYDRKRLEQVNRRSTERRFPQTIIPSETVVVFRVRTKVDEDGEILSAHYGKIYNPMYIMPGGETPSIQSFFYFNPIPNNRSLEFNKENLNPDPPSRGFAY